MEEIDIIELLKRAKEGKAPKKIEINGTIFKFCGTAEMVGIYDLYLDEENQYWQNYDIDLQTKITILDKPIIEELEIRSSRNYKDVNTDVLVYIDNEGKECECFYSVDVYIANKINEIIRYLKKED